MLGCDAAARYEEPQILILAAQQDKGSLVLLLLEDGADVDGTSDGQTALSAAVQCGNVGMVELLWDRGANVDRADGFGETAVFAAVRQSHAALLATLIARGADVNHASLARLRPLLLAVEAGDLRLVRLLVRAGAVPKTAAEEDFVLDDSVRFDMQQRAPRR
ncbi:ankyrin repeat-containing domain protein [Pelagophyceae sp. CCMP2097]|nr:ankyrin repeat-containing domain protein [Pelagophyceae sp. CCMP2097]